MKHSQWVTAMGRKEFIVVVEATFLTKSPGVYCFKVRANGKKSAARRVLNGLTHIGVSDFQIISVEEAGNDI